VLRLGGGAGGSASVRLTSSQITATAIRPVSNYHAAKELGTSSQGM